MLRACDILHSYTLEYSGTISYNVTRPDLRRKFQRNYKKLPLFMNSMGVLQHQCGWCLLHAPLQYLDARIA